MIVVSVPHDEENKQDQDANGWQTGYKNFKFR